MERVELRPLEQSDYEWLWASEVRHPTRRVRYRHRGSAPPPEAYAATLWAGVLVQLVVVDKDSSLPIALATCYSVDMRHQHAKLALVERADIGVPAGAAMAGFLRFVDYVFEVYPLRKLYLDVLEWNVERIASAERSGAKVEGRLVGHELHGGEPMDLVVYALHRDDWSNAMRALSSRCSVEDGATAPDRDCQFRSALARALGWPSDDPRFELPDLWAELDSLDRLLVLELIEGSTGRALPASAIEALADEATLRHLFLALRGY